MPYHFSPIMHIHQIYGITSTYAGQRNRGVVAETLSRIPTIGHLSYSMTRSVSNDYSVSIGFDKGLVDVTLGYDVSYSTTSVAEYMIDIPEYKLGSITLFDMYTVKLFDVGTIYYDPFSIEYGTGWAEQWTNFGWAGDIY